MTVEKVFLEKKKKKQKLTPAWHENVPLGSLGKGLGVIFL